MVTVRAPLFLDLVLCNLEDAQVFSEVFHREGVFRREVFHLLHCVESRVELREHFAKLYVIELFYKDICTLAGRCLPPLKSLKILSCRRNSVLYIALLYVDSCCLVPKPL